MATKHNRVITRKQLDRFIRIRNKSPFNNNLQFSIDADECGFYPAELGTANKTPTGYNWRTSHGLLIEEHGQLRLEPYPPED